jgi:hypothetical protein
MHVETLNQLEIKQGFYFLPLKSNMRFRSSQAISYKDNCNTECMEQSATPSALHSCVPLLL